MKNVLWIALTVVIAIMLYQGNLFCTSGYSLLELQFSNANQGQKMLQVWSNFQAGDRTLLEIAKTNTRLDFLFILLYLLQLITISNALMQREKITLINELLRMNIMLAVLIGILDATENIIQLHNFHFPADVNMYLSTFYLSSIKWMLAAWAVLVLLVSWLKRIF